MDGRRYKWSEHPGMSSSKINEQNKKSIKALFLVSELYNQREYEQYGLYNLTAVMRGEQYPIRPEGKNDKDNRVNGWKYNIEPRFSFYKNFNDQRWRG